MTIGSGRQALDRLRAQQFPDDTEYDRTEPPADHRSDWLLNAVFDTDPVETAPDRMIHRRRPAGAWLIAAAVVAILSVTAVVTATRGTSRPDSTPVAAADHSLTAAHQGGPPSAAPRSDGPVPSPQVSAVTKSAPAPRVLVAATDAWKKAGTKIIKDEKDHPSTNMVKQEPFAVLSRPVDITGAGTYRLIFDMPASYNDSAPPEGMASGIGFNFPGDMRDKFEMAPGLTKFTKSAGAKKGTLTFQIRVWKFTAPYPAFTVWTFGGG